MKEEKTSQLPSWHYLVVIATIGFLFWITKVGIEEALRQIWGWWDVYP